MELIERYVAEVGRFLPEKARPDIQREIRSLLEDTLEDRARQEGRAADEGMAAALLKEFGSPQSVAASYSKPRYLVGPALYPAWETVMRVVLTVLAVLAVVEFAFSIARPGSVSGLLDVGAAGARAIGGFISGAFTSLGIITFIFALIEWFDPRAQPAAKDWDPLSLKPLVAEGEPYKPGSLAVDITLNLLGIVVFLFYFDRIGIYFLQKGTWVFTPLFSSAFSQYLPYLVGLAGLRLALDVWVLQAGGWRVSQRVGRLVLRLASIGLLIALASGPSLVAPAGQLAAAWGQAGLDAARAVDLHALVDTALRVAFALGILGETIEFGKDLYRLATARPAK